MHSCPECGCACYCDMDDIEMPAPSNCRHARQCRAKDEQDQNNPIADYFDEETD